MPDAQLPATHEAFEKLLQAWNVQALFARPAEEPGQWKARNNRAANTVFVEPALVRGTLAKRFKLILLARLAQYEGHLPSL